MSFNLTGGPSRPHSDAGTLARAGVIALAAAGLFAQPARSQDSEKARLDFTTSSDEAKQHAWAGIADWQNIFPSRATMHFEMALDADPGFGLAKVLHAAAKPGLTGDQRRAGITEGLGMMSEASTAEILLATGLREWRSGNGAAAGRIFETASQLVPGDPYVAQWSTQFAGARGDPSDLVARWQSLIDRFPDHAPAHNILAYNQWARGNHAAAMTAVKEYASLASDHPNPHDSYAELLQWDGRYAEAMLHYQRATELDAGFNQGYVGAAEIHYFMGDIDAAVAQMRLATEHAISPQNRVTTMRQTAAIQMLDGDRGAAMQTLAAAAEAADAEGLTNLNANVHRQMALTDALLNRGRTMQDHLDKAAEIGGADSAAQLASVGLAHAIAGDATAATEAATKLADPSNSPFWQSISKSIVAMVQLGEGNAEAALTSLSGADPSNALVQAVMADYFDATGNSVAAADKRMALMSNRQINLANSFAMVALAYARKTT